MYRVVCSYFLDVRYSSVRDVEQRGVCGCL